MASRPTCRATVVALALALLAALPYLAGGKLRSFIHMDDNLYVFDNPAVLNGLGAAGVRWAFTAFHSCNWHPLTWLSHMLDVSLFGTAAWGHHLTSVLLHALSTGLLYLALRRLTGAPWASAFAAALFGVHPLRVESVAWIAERKDVLSGLFFVLVLLAYERYARRRGAGRYLAVAALLALGLMAKPMLVTAPFVLMLLDVWPLGRVRAAATATGGPGIRETWRGPLVEKLPLLALCAGSSVVTFLAQQWGGAVKDLTSYSPGVRLANALLSYTGYLGKSVWPASLAIYYPHPLAVPPWWALAGVLLVLGAISLAALRWFPSRPYFAIGWLWYLGMLVPVIGLVQLGDVAMADRYTYLPSVGLALIAAWGAGDVFRGARLRGAAAAGAVAVLCALSAATVVQVGHWRDSESLFRHAVAAVPGNWLVHNNLGTILFEADRIEESHEHFREAVRLRPVYPGAQLSLGLALVGLGRPGEAEAHFREAIRLDPRFAPPYVSLAEILARGGRTEEAIALCEEALRLKPAYPEAHTVLGMAHAKAGRLTEAIRHFEEAIRLRPDEPVFRRNLARARTMAAQAGGAGVPRR